MGNSRAHQKARTNPADLNWQLELPLRKARYAAQKFGAKAEQRFLTRKNNLDKVVYSLLRVKDGFQLRSSICGSRREKTVSPIWLLNTAKARKGTRGIIGPVAMDRAHPVLVDKLRSSAVGTLLEPFKLKTGGL